MLRTVFPAEAGRTAWAKVVRNGRTARCGLDWAWGEAMKKAILVAAQCCLFLVVFLAGTLMDPFHLRWFVTRISPVSTRYFVPDGLILACVVYGVIVGIEAATKRLRPAGALTTVAFVVALALGFLSKFGMATHDLY